MEFKTDAKVKEFWMIIEVLWFLRN